MLFKRFRSKDKSRGRRRSGLGPSILTGDLVIDGNLVSSGDVQVDGTINGDVRARSVVVDFNGVVHGEVAAEEVIVRGRVIGHIRGIHVHVFSGGHVEGDVLSETISIDHGAYIDGKIHRADDPLSLGEGAQEPADDMFAVRPGRSSIGPEEPGFRAIEATRRPKAAE